MFAEVSYSSRIFTVKVLKRHPRSEEFSSLVSECERLYSTLKQPFLLVFDLREMGLIGPVEVIQWMAMFVRVMPITKKYLHSTFLCVNNSLDEAIRMFLALYNPVKPFHVYHDISDFEAAVNISRHTIDKKMCPKITTTQISS